MVGFSWFFGGMMSLLCIAGLTMMESGFSRSKNAGSIMIEAIIGVTISIPCFMLLGAKIAGFEGNYALILEATLAALVCTILIGGLIGRAKVSGFIILCLVASALAYPLSVRGCNIIGSMVAYGDFGGFGCVFVSGAAAAYFATRVLKPRIGKSTEGGAAYVVPGHNIPFALTGVLLMSIGMIGMAGANGLLISMSEENLSTAAENVLMGGTVSGLVGFIFSYIRYKKPDMTMTASAVVAGLAAAIPGCDCVSIGWITVIAAFTGFMCVLGIENLERGAKIDDPAGVVAVFGIGGICGLLGTGIFNNTEAGLKVLIGNVITIIVIFAINGLLIGITGIILMKFKLLRVSVEQEVEGTDLSEYGLASCYNDFQMNLNTTDWTDLYVQSRASEAEEAETGFKEPYIYDMSKQSGESITKIEIICRKEKLESLKIALNDIGIQGMTVSAVTGCGVQKGYNEYYRGVPISVQLRAKARVEVVVAKVPVDDVVNTARRVLYTGHVGDGKIFIYSLNDVVRVRTGESGYAAMQGALSE